MNKYELGDIIRRNDSDGDYIIKYKIIDISKTQYHIKLIDNDKLDFDAWESIHLVDKIEHLEIYKRGLVFILKNL